MDQSTERDVKLPNQGLLGSSSHANPEDPSGSENESRGEVIDEKIKKILDTLPDFVAPYLSVLQPYSTQFLEWINDPDSRKSPSPDDIAGILPLSLTKFPIDLSLHLYHRFLEGSGLEKIELTFDQEGVKGVIRRNLVKLLKNDKKQRNGRSPQNVKSGTNELKILRKRCKNLQELVEAKETIIKETHHRTKNNLQVIISLLRLKRRKGTDSPEKILDQVQQTLRNIMTIHKKLEDPEGFQKRKIELKPYVRDLVHSLVNTFATDLRDVRLNISVNDLVVSMREIVPMALIINELVMNAIQHTEAKSDGIDPVLELSVDVTYSEGEMTLRVEDNGSGIDPLPDSDNGNDTADGKTARGLDIVQNLASNQLNGSVQTLPTTSGTTWTITFPYTPGTSEDEQLGSAAPTLEFD